MSRAGLGAPQVAVAEQRALASSGYVAALLRLLDRRGCLIDVAEAVDGNAADAEVGIEGLGVELAARRNVSIARR